jgi:cytochrome c peroxidase
MRIATHCLFAACLCMLASCDRARQFPPLVKKSDKKSDPQSGDSERALREFDWLESRSVHGVPLVFVPEANETWKRLPPTWHHSPALATVIGTPTSPMQAAAALVFSEQQRIVQIKLPRGLAYMAPTFPEANAPTLGKWRLGKTLFFMPLGPKKISCAHCHHPRHGFAADPSETHGARYDAPSLINVAYNRRQFWDGRAATLEETLFHGMDDEREGIADKRVERGRHEHAWSTVVKALADDKRLDKDFQDAFGTEHPTRNAVAQALATYLRTILSGDSIYDRADQVRLRKNAATLKAEHFAEVMDTWSLATLRDNPSIEKPTRDEMPALLERGFALFHGKARCAKCHHGPLFTDHDFHNIGCDVKENWPIDGAETGHSLHAPHGLKQARYVGAFRTPSLRNLNHTAPYFHNGSQPDLHKVIAFYDRGILPDLPYLANELKDGEKVQRLNLAADEVDALVLFLRSLQGRPVDPIVTTP